MKYLHVKKLDIEIMIPETVIETVDNFETFLINDLGNSDWNEDYIKTHFEIFRKDVQKIIDLAKEKMLIHVLRPCDEE